MKNRIIITGMALFFSATVFAQTNTSGVNQHQKNQIKRIHNGVDNGSLTKGEAKQLYYQQKNIQQTKKNAKSDGIVTKKERAHLHAKQHKASGNIYRKKHNNVNRN